MGCKRTKVDCQRLTFLCRDYDTGQDRRYGRGKCILQVCGVRPFFSDKSNITKHPKYKYLWSNADPKTPLT